MRLKIINGFIHTRKKVLNEPIVIGSRNNIRASQIEGINLMMDIRPREVRRKNRSPCLDSSAFESSGTSISSGLDVAQDEFDLPKMVGKRLGVDFEESAALIT